MKTFSTYLASLFGIGYIPGAPGTWGTAAAALLYFLIPDAWTQGLVPNLLFTLFVLAGSLLSVPVVAAAEKQLGEDDGKIVLDEFFGYCVAVLFVPKSLLTIIGAFVLFRIFDITKPGPVDRIQSLPKGWGVMADDLLAGVFANGILQIITRIIL
ncbi:MAG: phosphatidylglycerophosphatase A [Candidatus Cloacimonetes bacterium]|nr:phosphatidylglycerophosphatase A [Candidatus Cloacimonadota bacterium]